MPIYIPTNIFNTRITASNIDKSFNVEMIPVIESPELLLCTEEFIGSNGSQISDLVFVNEVEADPSGPLPTIQNNALTFTNLDPDVNIWRRYRSVFNFTDEFDAYLEAKVILPAPEDMVDHYGSIALGVDHGFGGIGFALIKLLWNYDSATQIQADWHAESSGYGDDYIAFRYTTAEPLEYPFRLRIRRDANGDVWGYRSNWGEDPPEWEWNDDFDGFFLGNMTGELSMFFAIQIDEGQELTTISINRTTTTLGCDNTTWP